MMMDADVQISCEDLKFSLTSWQSSQDSMVGFFPRLHRTTRTTDSRKSAVPGPMQFEYLTNWFYVWYNQFYSLLLPAGAIVHKRYLQDIGTLHKHISFYDAGTGNEKLDGIMTTKQLFSARLRNFLNVRNECAELALNVWIASLGAVSGPGDAHIASAMGVSICQPPIWLDIAKSYVHSPEYTKGSSFAKAENLRKRERSSCLTGLTELLEVKHLPVSVYKSVQSKTQLWWS